MEPGVAMPGVRGFPRTVRASSVIGWRKRERVELKE